MKLKYYLRGVGIGMIVTTIILAISFSQREVEISDEQVKVRAAALGMVMPEEDAKADTMAPEGESESSNNIEQETENSEVVLPTEEVVPETQQMTAETPTSGTYRLVINTGDVCRVVCENLQANGVVEDAEALRTYLFEMGYANSISTGSYDVPYGLTMEEVARIIIDGPIE